MRKSTPLILKAIEERLKLREVAFTEWDLTNVLDILRGLDKKDLAELRREYPQLYRSSARLLPRLLSKGRMTIQRTDAMLIKFLYEGLSQKERLAKLRNRRIGNRWILQNDIARVTRILWLSPIIAGRFIDSLERRKDELTIQEIHALYRLKAAQAALPSELGDKLESIIDTSSRAAEYKALCARYGLVEEDFLKEEFPIEAILQSLPPEELRRLLESDALSTQEREILKLRLSDVPCVSFNMISQKFGVDKGTPARGVKKAEAALERRLLGNSVIRSSL